MGSRSHRHVLHRLIVLAGAAQAVACTQIWGIQELGPRNTDGGAMMDTMTDSGGDSACAPNANFPANPVLDSFDEAGVSAPSDQWTGPDVTSYAIQTGHLVAPDGIALLWGQEFQLDQEAYATLSTFDDNLYDMSLLLKVKSTDGQCERVSVGISQFRHWIYVGYCTSNKSYLLYMGSYPLRPGMRIGARVYATGRIDVYVDCQLLTTQQIPTASTSDFAVYPWLDSPGRIGVYSVSQRDGGGVPSEWDDFGGGSVDPLP